jgi:Protein of unknown function (DUF1579)
VRLTGAGGLVLLALAAGSGPAQPAEERGSGLELRPLDPLAGTWSFEGKWQGADGRPARGNGVSENRWILGGRYLQCDAAAQGTAGERIESRIVLGYDGRHQHYFALILDNQNSYYLQPTGSYRASTRSFVLSGKGRDDASGLPFSYRLLLRVEGPDRYVIEVFFDTLGPAPISWFEAVYTRREASP